MQENIQESSNELKECRSLHKKVELIRKQSKNTAHVSPIKKEQR